MTVVSEQRGTEAGIQICILPVFVRTNICLNDRVLFRIEYTHLTPREMDVGMTNS